MATLEDLTAAADAVSQAVTDLIAKAEAVVVPDFQPAVDTLNQAAAAAQAFLNPPAPAVEEPSAEEVPA